jgi:hypothetical protein
MMSAFGIRPTLPEQPKWLVPDPMRYCATQLVVTVRTEGRRRPLGPNDVNSEPTRNRYVAGLEGTGTLSTLSTSSALTSKEGRTPRSSRCAASHASAVW